MPSVLQTASTTASLKKDGHAVQAIPLPNQDHLIGQILVKHGKLDPAKIPEILQHQQQKNIRFGDAAMQLGYVKEADVRYALSRQYQYPCLSEGDGLASDDLVAAYQPFSQQTEELRHLRSQLMLRWFTTMPMRNTLAIISAHHGEGRSYLTANLAVLFSQLGKRVLLIDADMRKPSQHKHFNLPNQSGLSSILSGRSDATCIQQVPSFKHLSLLTAGPTPPNPQELLGQPLFNSLLVYAGQEFDVVLLDTPAASEYADATSIAMHSRGALLVSRRDASKLGATFQITENLAQVGVPLVGAVLNHF